MGINSATIKFKNDLVSLINHSELPMCNIEMVMNNVLSAVQTKLKEAIALEESEVGRTNDENI